MFGYWTVSEQKEHNQKMQSMSDQQLTIFEKLNLLCADLEKEILHWNHEYSFIELKNEADKGRSPEIDYTVRLVNEYKSACQKTITKLKEEEAKRLEEDDFTYFFMDQEDLRSSRSTPLPVFWFRLTSASFLTSTTILLALSGVLNHLEITQSSFQVIVVLF